MTSPTATAIESLKTRLLTIKESASYSATVKEVEIDGSEMMMNVGEARLPRIEIFDDQEDYNHEVGVSYWSRLNLILFIGAPKSWTNTQMHNLCQDIRKAMFGGTSDATGNTGIPLDQKTRGIELVSLNGDLNMIETNRIYVMRICLVGHRVTYSD